MSEEPKFPSWLTDHIALYKSDPIAAHDWEAPAGGPGLVPTLLLTFTGRKSGIKRDIPLLYQPTGSGFVVTHVGRCYKSLQAPARSASIEFVIGDYRTVGCRRTVVLGANLQADESEHQRE